MAKNKQSSLISSVKMLNIGLINKYITNKGLGDGGGGYLVLLNYQSLFWNIFPLHPPIIFLYKI